MDLRSFAVRNLPFLGLYRRFAVATQHTIRPLSSHSQYGEDRRALELLADYDLSQGSYVDVGGNHPTTFSNSYLFYRKGMRGIVVEPNPEFVRLFNLFRPRDVVMQVGCSDVHGVGALAISKTPLLSSLDSNLAGEIWKRVFVPLVPLDAIVETVNPAWIPFLSVDVEGHDAAVLRGAKATLRRTFLVCVEAWEGTPQEQEVRALLREAGFSVRERCHFSLLATNDDQRAFQNYLLGGATRQRAVVRCAEGAGAA